jgi:hypothetical protein
MWRLLTPNDGKPFLYGNFSIFRSHSTIVQSAFVSTELSSPVRNNTTYNLHSHRTITAMLLPNMTFLTKEHSVPSATCWI